LTSTEKQHIAGRDWFTDADLDAPEFNEHYDEVVDTLVRDCPVARSNVGHGYWVVNRFEDVRQCAQDFETFSNTGGFQPNAAEDSPKLYPQELDPPYHTRWRKALAPYFSARAVKSHEPEVVELVNSLIDGFIERGECDFVDEFAAPLPGRVFFSSYLGVPLDDLDYLRRAVDDAMRGPVEERGAGWQKTADYLADYLRQREKEPARGDFVDAILAGVPLDDGAPCPWDHKVSTINDLLAGGIVTTTYLLGSIAFHLATTPEDRHRLAQDESLHLRAVEELSRAHPSVVALGRTATRDTEVAGQKIAKGEMVVLNFAGACRDPRVVADPLEVKIDRELPLNAAFGFGRHRCLGSHVARQNATVMIRELLARIPDFEMPPGAGPTFTTGITRSMDTLPLIFQPGAARTVTNEVRG
jgi:cytochrome P450